MDASKLQAQMNALNSFKISHITNLRKQNSLKVESQSVLSVLCESQKWMMEWAVVAKNFTSQHPHTSVLSHFSLVKTHFAWFFVALSTPAYRIRGQTYYCHISSHHTYGELSFPAIMRQKARERPFKNHQKMLIVSVDTQLRAEFGLDEAEQFQGCTFIFNYLP